MVTWHTIQCSDCAGEFQAPFVPTPGRRLHCPFCNIRYNDMRKSDYFIRLVAFLGKYLSLPPKSKLAVYRAEGDYAIVVEPAEKRAEVKIIAIIKWAPMDKDKLLLSPMALAVINIKDKTTKKIFEDFTKKNGLGAQVPAAPLNRF